MTTVTTVTTGPLLHLGAVHGIERLLVAVLALAPFVLLAVVAVVARRRQAHDDES